MKIAHLIIEWPLTVEALQHICSVISSYVGEDSEIRPTDGKRLRIELAITHFTENEQEIQGILQAMKMELLSIPAMILAVDYDEEEQL